MQRITCGCPDCRALQLRLDQTLNEYHKKIRRLEALEIDVNFDTLFELSQVRIDCTVGTYFCRMIERMESVDKYGTASKYRVTYSLWRQFHPQDMRFEEITLSLLRAFELFLRRRGNKDNSIATKFSVLRAVYNWASEERVFSSDENPFLRFKLGRLWTVGYGAWLLGRRGGTAARQELCVGAASLPADRATHEPAVVRRGAARAVFAQRELLRHDGARALGGTIAASA